MSYNLESNVLKDVESPLTSTCSVSHSAALLKPSHRLRDIEGTRPRSLVAWSSEQRRALYPFSRTLHHHPSPLFPSDRKLDVSAPPCCRCHRRARASAHLSVGRAPRSIDNLTREPLTHILQSAAPHSLTHTVAYVAVVIEGENRFHAILL